MNRLSWARIMLYSIGAMVFFGCQPVAEEPAFEPVSGGIVEGAVCNSPLTALRCVEPSKTAHPPGMESCLVGERRCVNEAWGPCENLNLVEVPLAPVTKGTAREALIGAPELCGGCDDRCFVSRDIPNDGDFDDPAFNVEDLVYDAGRGGLVIGSGKVAGGGLYAWISSNGSNVVNKLSMETLENVGVYRTGRHGVTSDPSRTAVDHHGNVYVANRANASVTKIAGSIGACLDRDGDGGLGR